MKKKMWTMCLLVLVLLTGCSQVTNLITGCPDGEISWIDALKINDITYDRNNVVEAATFEKGQKIGEVRYMLAGNACSNHRLRNGDAAFLAVGTEIYTLAGYETDFRVVAGDHVYQVSENNKAKTIKDLFDIEGKVIKMSYESEEDGRHLADFTAQQATTFTEALLSQEYIGYSQVAKQIQDDDKGVFLRLHLQDGSSFHIVYWLNSNALSIGAFGTEEMQQLLLEKVKEVTNR